MNNISHDIAKAYHASVKNKMSYKKSKEGGIEGGEGVKIAISVLDMKIHSYRPILFQLYIPFKKANLLMSKERITAKEDMNK